MCSAVLPELSTILYSPPVRSFRTFLKVSRWLNLFRSSVGPLCRWVIPLEVSPRIVTSLCYHMSSKPTTRSLTVFIPVEGQAQRDIMYSTSCFRKYRQSELLQSW